MSDDRFDVLSQNYEAEQKRLEAEVITLRQEIEAQEQQNENIEKFIQKAHKYVDIETLDPYVLRELVQAIYVEAPDKSSGKRRPLKTQDFQNFMLILTTTVHSATAPIKDQVVL